MRPIARSTLLLAAAGWLVSGVARAAAGRPQGGRDTTGGRRMPSSFEGSITVYSADWCGYCKKLQQGLRDAQIPFDVIDIERNPSAHERARQATGTSAIPVTSIARGADVTWVVGADLPAVIRAYRR